MKTCIYGLENSSIMEIKESSSVAVSEANHHIKHALTLFTFMAYETLSGREVRHRLLDRVFHHLMYAAEFIENPFLNDRVSSLSASIWLECYKSMCRASAESHESQRCFIDELEDIAPTKNEPTIDMYLWFQVNQHRILELADYYGKISVFDALIPMAERWYMKDDSEETYEL